MPGFGLSKTLSKKAIASLDWRMRADRRSLTIVGRFTLA